MQDTGNMNWGMVIGAVLFGIAIWKIDSRVEKIERRLDELSGLLSEKFNIEV